MTAFFPHPPGHRTWHDLRLQAAKYGVAQLRLAGLERFDTYRPPYDAVGRWFAGPWWCDAWAEDLWRRASRAPVRLAEHHARAEAVRVFYEGA
jgi:hypothetical protein